VLTLCAEEGDPCVKFCQKNWRLECCLEGLALCSYFIFGVRQKQDEGNRYVERKMVMLLAIHQENHKFELPVATFPLML
jgi:hypothetical protein